MNRRPFFVIGAVLVAIIAIIVYCRRDIDQDQQVARGDKKDGATASGITPPEIIPGRRKGDPSSMEVGGVRRPATDFAADKVESTDQEFDDDDANLFDYGSTPAVDPNANEQVAQVARSIREKRNFEQVSTLISPPKFDREAFDRDPQAYIDRVEPGRVFQVLQPSADTPALRKASPLYQEIKQGESVYLQVAAPQESPVTFTSLDLGMFENQLTSITVRANSRGVARASFFGTPGTIDDVDIMAGSPVASGNVRFVVNVRR